MSTNKKSPQKSTTKSAASKKTATKKSSSGAKTASAKSKPTSAQVPKKKPGRPKKQVQSPSVRYKADAKDRDNDGRIGVQAKPAEPKNVQATGAGIPSASTTTRAAGATPKVEVNLSWQDKKTAGFWARLGSKLKRKK